MIINNWKATTTNFHYWTNGWGNSHSYDDTNSLFVSLRLGRASCGVEERRLRRQDSFVPGQDYFWEFSFIVHHFVSSLFTLREKCVKCKNVLEISRACEKSKSPVSLSLEEKILLLLPELSRHNLCTYKWIPVDLLTHLSTTDINSFRLWESQLRVKQLHKFS